MYTIQTKSVRHHLTCVRLVLTFVALMHFANPIQPDVYRSNWSSGLQTGQPDFLPGQ